jgi:hypothetical protein
MPAVGAWSRGDLPLSRNGNPVENLLNDALRPTALAVTHQPPADKPMGKNRAREMLDVIGDDVIATLDQRQALGGTV